MCWVRQVLTEENSIAVQVDATSFRNAMSSMMQGTFSYITQIERQVEQIKEESGGMEKVADGTLSHLQPYLEPQP